MFLARLAFVAAFLPTAAFAQTDTSRDALARLEETLAMRLQDEGLAAGNLLPAIVVSVTPAFEETKTWYPTAALATLVTVFGAASLRSCEACMAPRTFIGDGGRIEQTTVAMGVTEIARLDEAHRGSAPPARTAIWLDENANGVSLRMIDLQNSRILMASNFDPSLRETARSRRNYTMVRELDRRSAGNSLTHAFFDAALYPGQHISLDWSEQWGSSNANLSGLSISLFDPFLGLGGSYFRVVPSARNIAVGGKILMSIPSAAASSIAGTSVEVIDPLLTGVFMARLPIASTNFGLILSASTNGQVGLGITLMNSSFLPFLP